MNTLTVPLFARHHPHPAELARALDDDLREPTVTPVPQKDLSSRVSGIPARGRQWQLETGAASSGLPRDQVVELGEVIVEQAGDSLTARTRDGRASWDLMTFMGSYLTGACGTHFDLHPSLAHVPRVTIDRLVITRERWRFQPDELAFAWKDSRFEQLAEARRWTRARGLPRWVFAKIPEETKPCYVDFESALYVEILAKLVRKASVVTLTEMLPTVEQSWLTDAEGRSYASELRLAAVDPSP
jgi:hypothetical protein